VLARLRKKPIYSGEKMHLRHLHDEVTNNPVIKLIDWTLVRELRRSCRNGATDLSYRQDEAAPEHSNGSYDRFVYFNPSLSKIGVITSAQRS
jgi:hypothetical protein